jgi:hypothetical protein
MQENWTDWRRTGFPAITKVANAVTSVYQEAYRYRKVKLMQIEMHHHKKLTY